MEARVVGSKGEENEKDNEINVLAQQKCDWCGKMSTLQLLEIKIQETRYYKRNQSGSKNF